MGWNMWGLELIRMMKVLFVPWSRCNKANRRVRVISIKRERKDWRQGCKHDLWELITARRYKDIIYKQDFIKHFTVINLSHCSLSLLLELFDFAVIKHNYNQYFLNERSVKSLKRFFISPVTVQSSLTLREEEVSVSRPAPHRNEWKVKSDLREED